MRIGIDIRFLARGTRSGVEEYTIHLISHLVRLAPDIRFKFFYNAFRKERLDFPWTKGKNVEVKEFSFPNRMLDIATGNISLPKIDRLLGGCDVFLSPHFFIAPVSRTCKKIVVFHDLSFEYYPEFFSLSKRYWHRSMNPRKTACEADVIIAVSESTKADLINVYGIDGKKIQMVYPGVSEAFRPITEETGLNRVKEKYVLPDEFILYFGTIEPRKNIIGIIKAFELLKNIKTKEHRNIKLVIAGSRGWLYKNILREARKSSHRDDIVFTGFIEEEDKSYLYNLAKIFVYPSFFEGFGFPPLEAMACGVPAVVSHVTSLPEVVEDAAIMINPSIYGEITDAIEMLLGDRELYNEFSKRGIEQAKKFSWERSARDVLELILGR